MKRHGTVILAITMLAAFSGCALPHVAIIKDPLTATEHLELGLAYEQRGEYEPAIREYKSAAEEIPLAYLYLGNIYFVQEKHGLSEKAYLRAIKGLPDNPRPHNNLAWLYCTRGVKLEQAERLARHAVALASSETDEACRNTLKCVLEKRSQGRASLQGANETME